MTDKQAMISSQHALPGRTAPVLESGKHFVNQSDLTAPLDNEQQEIVFGMGCFWGAERLFWKHEGVVSTSVGYAGGFTPNPTYEEVCSGQTGHTEVVRVRFDPSQTDLNALLTLFWENHDPTQGMRQGNDLGTQYRSAIYISPQQEAQCISSKQAYQQALKDQGLGPITTEILLKGEYYLAEEYHQQYLAKNPQGYCGIGGTGICLPPSLNQD
ncbi:peptide-methionine (S)-S-oxide reductase MsrA [Vibrio sp. SCSIO 43136]|uniref:peptide-methionine (S)-S-oxide reductase MsrA n=1 Tax=Vibrio sp. SCSIO 43136 TaxID=2819101 RepID=UPI0020753C54|nr:peptide-methionine (S)-S-oxide reductase MsrA [Vibrio sp. SCSIO 43136]USD64982.1 peptide-methionine (S)-S-oxide reductase MsrA [Vibrio sp. SCSIO 43136]